MTKPMLRRLVAFSLITGVVFSYQACGPAGTSAGGGSSGSSSKGGSYMGGTTTDNPKVSVNLMLASYTSSLIENANLCVKEISFGSSSTATQDSSSTSSKFAERMAKRKALREEIARLEKLIGDEIALREASGEKHSRKLRKLRAALRELDDIDSFRELAELQEEIASLFATAPSRSEYSAPPSGAYVDVLNIPSDTYDEVAIELKPDCASGSLSVKTAKRGVLSSRSPLKLRFRGRFSLKNAGDLRLDMQPIVDALGGASNAEEFAKILETTLGGIQ